MRDALVSVVTAVLVVAGVTLPFWLISVGFAVDLVRPLGLVLGVLAVPLLLLYVLRSRRPRRTVGSLLFWRGVVLEQQANTPFQRLRRRIPLLLQLLALAGLAYALAGPSVQTSVGHAATRLAIVIDVSASMLVRDSEDAPNRFEDARLQALELISGLGPDDEAMLVAAGRRPWIAVPWTRSAAALQRGLSELQVRHVPGRLDQALVLVAASRPGEAVEVHLYSDGGGPPPGELELPGSLHYHPVGNASENVGITAAELRARVGPAQELTGSEGLAYEVFASVLNSGAGERDVFVSLERAGRLLAARRVTIPGGRAHPEPVVLEARLTPGPVQLRLLDPRGAALDPFPLDDEAWLLVPREEGAAVGLLSRQESPALRRALEAAGGRLGGQDDRLRLLVCEELLPPHLPPVDCLFVAPEREVGPVALGEEVRKPRVAGWDRADPLLRFVDLHDLEIERCRPLQLGPGARALLHGEDPLSGEAVVLMATWEAQGDARVVIGFDLYRSTWPLRASFPIFVRNLLERARGDDALGRGAAITGTPLTIPVDAGKSELELRLPSGAIRTLQVRQGKAELAEVPLVGVYEFEGRQFCANLVSAEESRIAPQPLRLGDQPVTPAAESSERPLDVSWLFALVALLVLSVEAWAYHRRW